MRQTEPFTALIVALFSWTSWLDGSVWASGACAGVAAMLFLDFLSAAGQRHNEGGG